MIELIKVTEIYTKGCIEDESESHEYIEHYYLFDDEESKEDFLIGYYENQDYSYYVQVKSILKVENLAELIYIEKCITSYLKSIVDDVIKELNYV